MKVLVRACLLLVLLLPAPAFAQLAVPGFPEATATERWVWQELRAGRIANLNERCGTPPLDPRRDEEVRWRDACRQVRPAFLEWLLTGEVWRAAPAHRGVRIRGARIDGELDLGGAKVEMPVSLHQSRVEGTARLADARFASVLRLDASTFAQGISADRLQVEGGLYLSSGAAVRGGALSLIGARINGDVSMDRSSFAGGIQADSISVGGSLSISDGAAVPGTLVLRGASISGDLAMVGSNFTGGIHADSLSVGVTLFLRDGRFRGASEFPLARIGSNVDLSNASLAGLILNGASIGGELNLGHSDRPAPRWAEGAELDLRNLRAGALNDRWKADEAPKAGEGCRGAAARPNQPYAWPCRVRFQGFSFERLGGLSGGGDSEMLVRAAHYYTALLERDQSVAFSRQPYQQFAGAFRAVGDKDRAAAILYAARDREIAHLWLSGEWRAAAALFLLKITIGYGLGAGYWLALAWVGFFTMVGVLVLRAAPGARDKGFCWRFGASLSRLLPIVELNAEFTEFFNDPKRERLQRLQLGYFAIHAILGYVLAAFVAAGVAGLTQAD